MQCLDRWEILWSTLSNPLVGGEGRSELDVRPDRSLTMEETVDVFSRLEDPNLLICETCISTGTGVSEVVGLQQKHVVELDK
jgi:hypothetical protein